LIDFVGYHAPVEYGLTDEGFIAPRPADFLTLIRAEYEARLIAAGLGGTVDWERDLFVTSVVTIMADMLGGLGEAAQALYDAFDVNGATALQLDNLCLIVGVTRNEATHSTATLTCTGTNGTVILEGSLVEGGGEDGKARWEVLADATIAAGTATVQVQCTEAGAIAATIGEIDAIVTPISGWSTVTNAADATSGDDRETDAALRKRRQQSLQIAGSANLASIRANVLDVDGVQACVVIENDTPVTATVEGISLPGSSVCVITYPGSGLTDDQRTAVIEAIYDRIAGGIRAYGTDAVATVTGLDGYAKTVAFNYATTLAVTVAITVALDTGLVVGDVDGEIISLVEDYLLTLGVGDAVRLLSISALIATVEGVTGAAILLNGVAADVTPTVTQIPTLSGSVGVS
jgi:uncharacterized phage protein gp47/JayE